MRIVILHDSIYQKTPFSTLNDLKIYLSELLYDILKQLDLPVDIINNIFFISAMPVVGEVRPYNITPLKIDIFFQTYLIVFLLSQDVEEKSYARSIIFHEFYHCKEFITTFSKLDYFVVCKDISNYNELCINLGYHQWSEYYAHYNSSKIYLSDGLNDDKIFSVLAKSINSFDANNIFSEYDLQKSLYNNVVHPFIKNVVLLIANYHQTQNDLIVNRIKKYINLNTYIYDYFNNTSILLQQFYKEYPNNIEYDSFIILGSNLLDIKLSQSHNNE